MFQVIVKGNRSNFANRHIKIKENSKKGFQAQHNGWGGKEKFKVAFEAKVQNIQRKKSCNFKSYDSVRNQLNIHIYNIRHALHTDIQTDMQTYISWIKDKLNVLKTIMIILNLQVYYTMSIISF